MTRLTRAWGALAPEQRLAAVAALALLITMFLPWYDLQSLDRKTGVINSHSISAFGDVSFVEAAVFLVAAGVLALLFARSERKDFHMPGSDGTVVMLAGAWATLLIFYRVFSRPAGHGYPVGIEWGFLLAFLTAGVLTFAGWRMHAAGTPEAPLRRGRGRRGPGPRPAGQWPPGEMPSPERPPERRPPAERPSTERPPASEDLTVLAPSPPGVSHAAPIDTRPVPAAQHAIDSSEDITSVVQHSARPPQGTPQSFPPTQGVPQSSPPANARRAGGSPRKRPRFPPAPSDQLSFEDPPPEQGER
jgi:hypothetical protein